MCDNKLILKKIGLNIRKHRLKLNLSQEELGFECDISRNQISLIELGKINIGLTSLVKILKILPLKIEDLK